MLISRRKLLCSLAAGAAGGFGAVSGPVRVLIVTASREGPHAIVIEGLQRTLAEHSITSSAFRLASDEAALHQELSSQSGQIAVALGTEALQTLLSAGSRIPLVATMAFRTDFANLAAPSVENRLAGAVWLDIPIPSVTAGLLCAFPSAGRLALVRNPAQPDPGTAQLPPGIVLKPVECRTATDLLSALRKLKGQVDFVLCTPDSSLYNKTTVEPLILASLEHRLPLVGYSASFVHAGAAVGVYPDFLDIGRQTAALCERLLANASGPREEHPRKTAVAVNERVLHLLGRDYKSKPNDEVMVVR
jgi:ABC-type uncharacterized transport system substrate-binding protein